MQLVCLRDKDTLYLKIINHSGKVIFIPESYDVDFTLNDDNLHLLTVKRPVYSTTFYYVYKTLFPFEFSTTKPIESYKPDTVYAYKGQVYYFNQFLVQPFISIKNDSSYFEKLVFSVPQHTPIVRAVYYHKPYLDSVHSIYTGYTLEDFLKFDSINANYACARINDWQ